MVYATASEIKNNFGKYLDLVLTEGEVTIIRHKRPIVRMAAITVLRSNEKDSYKNDDNSKKK